MDSVQLSLRPLDARAVCEVERREPVDRLIGLGNHRAFHLKRQYKQGIDFRNHRAFHLKRKQERARELGESARDNIREVGRRWKMDRERQRNRKDGTDRTTQREEPTGRRGDSEDHRATVRLSLRSSTSVVALTTTKASEACPARLVHTVNHARRRRVAKTGTTHGHHTRVCSKQRGCFCIRQPGLGYACQPGPGTRPRRFRRCRASAWRCPRATP